MNKDRYFTYLSIALYLACLPFNSFDTSAFNNRPIDLGLPYENPGLFYLMFGALGLLGLEPRWFANLLLFLCWFWLLKGKLVYKRISILTLVFVLSALSIFYLRSYAILLDEDFTKGRPFYFSEASLGFWLWFLSGFVLFAYSGYKLLEKRREKVQG